VDSLIIACATCANSFKDTSGDAAGWSILFLLGVVVAMLAGVGFLMVRMARRSNSELDPELHDDFHTTHG